MKHKNKFIFLLPVILVSLFLQSCYDNSWEKHLSDEPQLKSDLFEVITTKSELSTFVSMLKKTGYDKLLGSSNSFTVFAPTNTAWSGVDTSDVVTMQKIVGTLIAYNTYYSDNEALLKSIKAVNGKTIFYNTESESYNGAKIISKDIKSGNGVIHITDKIVERKENIWDYLSTKTDKLQYQFTNNLNKRVMDTDKSIAIGVYPDGKTKFDTVWKNINNFLLQYPIDNEDSLYTYIVLENDGFNSLYTKYQKYFTLSTTEKTDSATRFNVCQDFVFKDIIDITKFDTLTNVDGVKVPVSNIQIIDKYEASNGRVYVINQSNIRLKDKIKPIKIEGEKYNKAFDANYVFTRYKRWASGERDIALSSGETQSDSLWRKKPIAPDSISKKDSVASKTYFVNGNLVANVANFYIEYKTTVNSANYDVYYVAYDDITDHFDPTYRNFGVYKITQKLFVSMPGANVLRHGTFDNSRGVANNYLGDTRCFVGEGMAGVKELTKLKQWDLVATTQLVSAPSSAPNADFMSVPRAGILTMWLCNTARSTVASRQGLLFLDYILLIPRITEE